MPLSASKSLQCLLSGLTDVTRSLMGCSCRFAAELNNRSIAVEPVRSQESTSVPHGKLHPESAPDGAHGHAAVRSLPRSPVNSQRCWSHSPGRQLRSRWSPSHSSQPRPPGRSSAPPARAGTGTASHSAADARRSGQIGRVAISTSDRLGASSTAAASGAGGGQRRRAPPPAGFCSGGAFGGQAVPGRYLDRLSSALPVTTESL